MLETLVASKVEHQPHGHNLAVGHRGLAAATLLPRSREEVFLLFGVKIFAEFVHSTENLSNFVIGNRKSVFFIVLKFSYKNTKSIMITFFFSDKVINKVIPNSRIDVRNHLAKFYPIMELYTIARPESVTGLVIVMKLDTLLVL